MLLCATAHHSTGKHVVVIAGDMPESGGGFPEGTMTVEESRVEESSNGVLTERRHGGMVSRIPYESRYSWRMISVAAAHESIYGANRVS